MVGRQNNRNSVPAGKPEEYYRRAVFLPFLDGILTQMSLRFCSYEASVLRLCGLLPKFALNVSFRDTEEGVDHYAALLYTMFRRGSTSSLNFSSDVIKIGSAETKVKTETDCTEAKTKTETSRAETGRDQEYFVLGRTDQIRNYIQNKIQNLCIKIMH
jgi:hypothetical protein